MPESEAQSIWLEITGTDGRVLMTKPLKQGISQSLEIDMEAYSRAIYFVVLRNESQVLARQRVARR